MDEKYQAELEKLNQIAKRNLTIAAFAAAAATVVALIILVVTKLR